MSSQDSFESESSVSSALKKRIPEWVKGLGIVAIALFITCFWAICVREAANQIEKILLPSTPIQH